MTDAVITEFKGTRRNGTILRFYQYGNGGVRVLDSRKNLKRLYRFDPSSDIMTECDPARPDRVLRRFVFDRMGMVEETFMHGVRPRTFRFEQGGMQIAIREGGDYGQVGKIITFEDNGVTETCWGRNGEIERVFVFEHGNETIVERTGGWFGDIDRSIVFEGIDIGVFRDPEAFLQFLVFTEWSAEDKEEHINEQVAKIHGRTPAAPVTSPYAYTGIRHVPEDTGSAARPRSSAATPSPRTNTGGSRRSRPVSADSGIDFIPDADAPVEDVPRGPPARRSDAISFDERLNRGRGDGDPFSAGKSAEISLQERFESARSSREPLSKGRSAEISLQDRFENARSSRGTLSKGKSVEIPLEERFGTSREHEQLSRGKSVDIPLEERFENARSSRAKLSKGRSAEIPYDERRGGDR